MTRRLSAQQKCEQGDLIEDIEDDTDSGVVELNDAAEGEGDQFTEEQMWVVFNAYVRR